MLCAGIVGMPNVGKSTLFNALTRSRKAAAENYPFCTIDPNLGMVTVPDERIDKVAEFAGSAKATPTAIEFVDIAGLVEGASKGAGLGNQFLANIREVDAIVQVVRCFEHDDIIHELGSVDPLRDIEIINSELILADIASLEKRYGSREKKAQTGDKEAQREIALMKKLLPHLNDGNPAITLDLSAEEIARMHDFFLLSAKPTIYACNVSEDQLATALKQPDDHPFVSRVRAHVESHHGTTAIVIAAHVEEELGELEPDEEAELLADMGVEDSGVSDLIRAAYRLLGLRTFFTANPKEARAWTVRAGAKAPQGAGEVHTDFERGFISAEVVHYDDYLAAAGNKAAARDAGKLRIEGKEYEILDGDVIEFRFNT
jgi:GTP-binding protein YchF